MVKQLVKINTRKDKKMLVKIVSHKLNMIFAKISNHKVMCYLKKLAKTTSINELSLCGEYIIIPLQNDTPGSLIIYDML